jgi:hypothetical protein
MSDLKRYVRPMVGLSLVLLFTRCSHVVNDPIGKRNPIDKSFIALSGLFTDADKYALISYENLVTRGIFNSLEKRISVNNIAEYTGVLLGKSTPAVGNSFWRNAFKAFSVLKDHPRGIKENAYSDDELKAFYISVIQDPNLIGGTDIKEPSVIKERSISYPVESLAKIAYNKISNGYISIVDEEIKSSGSDKTESANIRDFKVGFTGNANATLADIACRYVALSQNEAPSEYMGVYLQIAGKYVEHYSGNSTVKDIKEDLQQKGEVCPK